MYSSYDVGKQLDRKHGTSPSDVFSLYGICKTGRGIPEVYAFL